ncbi:hypothetical protein C1I95_27405 [Micromonospora craterilacus]|uniref:HTH cro/C1-type domain-containing protein n=1 Tax=Micromonospora craterilacus TaxID=1655439 RepID=A0A2W2DLT6_9ACTN|nr:hypothetical protein C1I95_27405 [Micromonospora craterilacus]
MRAELARQQKSQRDVAAQVGLSQASVQLRLVGERPFRAEELAIIADWLGVPAGQFLPPLATAGVA